MRHLIIFSLVLYFSQYRTNLTRLIYYQCQRQLRFIFFLNCANIVEDDIIERQPQCKMTSVEDNFNERRPHWKMTLLEDDLSGR